MFDPFTVVVFYYIHSYSRLLPERLGALFRDPVMFVLVLLLIGLWPGDFITSSLKALLQDCVLVYECSGAMNWEPIVLWQLYYVIVYP